MPSKEPYAIQMRGSESYSRALQALARKAGATNLSELTDRALRELAERHGINLPERVKPVGTNRYTNEPER